LLLQPSKFPSFSRGSRFANRHGALEFVVAPGRQTRYRAHMSDDLYPILARVGTLLRAEVRAEATRAGLAAAQLEVLHYLESCNRFSDTTLAVAEYLGTTRGTTSQTIQSLVDKGYVERHPDAFDGRVVHCQLTPAGHALAHQTRPPPALTQGLADADPRLAPLLTEMLRTLQRRQARRAFGVCQTCTRFQAQEGGCGTCGLSGEPLSAEDALLICRDHTEG